MKHIEFLKKCQNHWTLLRVCGLVPNSYIHVSASDLYIPTISLPVLLQENRWTHPGNI
jgi:hypothetical protein